MPRTRSASAHAKVLDAALELVAERGIEATSMDAIAAQSGVSKATIYKHWADKDALLLEMLSVVNGLDRRPVFDTGDVRADMTDVLAYRPRERVEMRERVMPHFMSYSATNVKFGMSWRHMVMDPPRRELRHLLQLGMETGELAADVDIDVSLALLLGPIMYWYIFLRRTTEEPRELAAAVVDSFWLAFGRSRAKKC